MHWQHCSQCELLLWLGAFKVVFPAEYLFNNVKQLGAGPARLWFGSVSITSLCEHKAAQRHFGGAAGAGTSGRTIEACSQGI